MDDLQAAVALQLCDTVLLCHSLNKLKLRRKKRSIRKWWVGPLNQLRPQQGAYDNLLAEMRVKDPDAFFDYTRMSIERFDYLLSLVGPSLKKLSRRQPLPEGMRLAITLRYLASGDSLRSSAWSYRIGRSTCSIIIHETNRVIWDVLSPIVMPEPKEADYLVYADGFADRWNLPNCVGAIDGKHCVIQAPPNSGSEFFNYKKTFSIVLLAVCNANYMFTHVDIGAFGSQSDGGILRNSEFGRQLLDSTLPLPPSTPLPYTTTPMPFFFAADEAFGLHNNILRPYPGRGLSEAQKVFNYRLSRGRRVIENAFGILVARWRIFHTVIQMSPENVDSVIKATVCLHNFLTSGNSDNTDHESFDDVPAMGPTGFLQNLNTLPKRVGSRNATMSATRNRLLMTQYVSSPAGSLEWQLRHVRQGLTDL